MKIDLKQPKYLLPLICLPFFFFAYYVYASNFKSKEIDKKQEAGLQSSTAEVSDEVKKRELSNKLDAYRNQYKEGNGITAISAIQEEQSTQNGKLLDTVSKISKAQQYLDSISQAAKKRVSTNQALVKPQRNRFKPQRENLNSEDQALALALSKLSAPKRTSVAVQEAAPVNRDPMETFKKQMAYLDSMKMANDPAYKEANLKKQALEKAANSAKDISNLRVVKVDQPLSGFHITNHHTSLIKAIIDENITAYSGSRLRIRLLEDISAGGHLIPRGTYIYAEINGFTEQRVNLVISSILVVDDILPVKLQVYDLDGLPGLYVPASAFREFSKELGTNTIQGVSVDNSTSSFTMSMMDKVFQSTSGAVASLIRKNKANIKYGTFVYLIDPNELKNTQKSY